MDSSSLGWLYHDSAESGRTSPQGSGDLLALPRREELRVYRLLAGWAERVRDLQGERASVAVGSMIHGLWEGRAPLAEFQRILDLWREAYGTGCKMYRVARAGQREGRE